MEPHSATKKEVLMHETTLMNLNKIMLSKRKQAQEGRADSISTVALSLASSKALGPALRGLRSIPSGGTKPNPIQPPKPQQHAMGVTDIWRQKKKKKDKVIKLNNRVSLFFKVQNSCQILLE